LITRKKSIILLIIVNFIWGGSYTFSKIALSEVSPSYLVAINYLLGSIILSMMFYKHLKKINMKSLYCGVITGTLVAIGTIMVSVGLKYTTSVKAGLLNSVELMTIPIVSWILFKDKFKLNDAISIFIAVCGIILINFNGITFTFNLGDLLCTIAPMLYALQISIISKYSKNIDEVQVTTTELFMIGIISLIVALIFETPPKVISNITIYSIIYLGIFTCAVAFYFETLALKRLKPTYAGLINATLPLFTMITSYVILGETLNVISLIGSFLIIAALLTYNIDIVENIKNKKMKNEININ
jgi:drug/metabolite transporter (DMT)-like permease